MRFVLFAAIAAVLAAVGYHFGQTDGLLANGFYRLLARDESLIALATTGLVAARLGDRFWLGAVIALIVAVATAFLTARGLELPETRAMTVLSLLALGVLGAMARTPNAAIALLFIALGGLIHGHVLTDDLGGAGEFRFLGGLALGVGAAIFGGAAVAAGADNIGGGLTAKIAAGVAGVGLFLTLGHFGAI